MSPDGPRIRPCAADELPALRDVERAAGALFRAAGMPEIAEDEPPSLTELARFQRAGLAWTAADTADRPVGYLVACVVDGRLHVEQVSVHPGHARRGIGRTLIDRASAHAARNGMAAVTLTTFAAVPWNAPYYERLGFRRLGEDELPPGLRAVMAREARHGLDRWPRVAMIRATG